MCLTEIRRFEDELLDRFNGRRSASGEALSYLASEGISVGLWLNEQGLKRERIVLPIGKLAPSVRINFPHRSLDHLDRLEVVSTNIR